MDTIQTQTSTYSGAGSFSPRLAIGFTILGFWVMYSGLIIDVFQGVSRADTATGTSLGSYLSMASVGSLWFASILTYKERRMGSRALRKLQLWLILSSVSVLMMIFESLFKLQVLSVKYVFLYSIPWISTALLPILGSPSYSEHLNKSYRCFAVIGVLVNLAFLFQNYNVISMPGVTRKVAFQAVYTAAPLLFTAPVIIFSFLRSSAFMRIISVFAALEMMYIAVVGETRQSVGLLAFIVLLSIWIHWRDGSGRQLQRLFKTSWTNLLLAAAVFALVLYIAPRIVTNIESFKMRFMLQQGGNSLRDNDRWSEVGVFFAQAEAIDLIFGRGVCGEFNNSIIPENPFFIHIGYVHAILKGGVVLCFLLVFGPIRTGIRSLVTSRNHDVLVAGGVCAWFAIKSLSGNILSFNPSYYLVLLCFGQCLFDVGETKRLIRHPKSN